MNSPCQELGFEPDTFMKVRSWVFNAFVLIKIILYVYKYILIEIRYVRTFKSYRQTEVWWTNLKILMLVVLLPNYFYKEINYLYFCFLLNSVNTYWYSYILHLRAAICLERPVRRVRIIQVYFAFQLLILLTSTLLYPLLEDKIFADKNDSAKNYNKRSLLFHCNKKSIIYRKYSLTHSLIICYICAAFRFLILFALDIISNFVDAISIWMYPSFVNKKQRLKIARIEMINRNV